MKIYETEDYKKDWVTVLRPLEQRMKGNTGGINLIFLVSDVKKITYTNGDK